jgi:hypothetical protein
LFHNFYIAVVALALLGCTGFLCGKLNAQDNGVHTNKGDLDGAFMVGPSFPWDSHKNGQINPKAPTQFATSGVSIRIEANAGFGNGWKFGLGLEVIQCSLDGEAMSDFLENEIKLPNFFVSKVLQEDPYYSSTLWFAQVENEIDYGRFRLSPHGKLGIATFSSNFKNEYHLKEHGTNYERDVIVTPYYGSLPGFVYGAGMKAGFSPDGPKGKFLFFGSADLLRFRTITGIEYETNDIFGNTTYSQDWFGVTIAYYSVMVGAAYYLR